KLPGVRWIYSSTDTNSPLKRNILPLFTSEALAIIYRIYGCKHRQSCLKTQVLALVPYVASLTVFANTYTSIKNSVRFLFGARFSFFRNRYRRISTPRVVMFSSDAISLLLIFMRK